MLKHNTGNYYTLVHIVVVKQLLNTVFRYSGVHISIINYFYIYFGYDERTVTNRLIILYYITIRVCIVLLQMVSIHCYFEYINAIQLSSTTSST